MRGKHIKIITETRFNIKLTWIVKELVFVKPCKAIEALKRASRSWESKMIFSQKRLKTFNLKGESLFEGLISEFHSYAQVEKESINLE